MKSFHPLRAFGIRSSRSVSKILQSFARTIGRPWAIRALLVLLIFGVGLTIEMTSEAQERGRGADKRMPTRTIEPEKKSTRRTPNFDIRISSGEAGREVVKRNLSRLTGVDPATALTRQRSSIEYGLRQLQEKRPDAEIDISSRTGAVEIVRSSDGLSGPDPRTDGTKIVRDFLYGNRDLYGLDNSQISELNFIGESVSRGSGLRMVRVEQMVNGRPVFQSETRFILDAGGRIIRSLGAMIPNAEEAAVPLEGLLSPEEALRRTMEPHGISLAGSIKSTASKDDAFTYKLQADDPNIAGDVTSKLVYFPITPGLLIPAYSQTVFGAKEDWYVLVDARDGALLWRKNIRSDASIHNARFLVYVQADGTTPADSPAPSSPTTALPGSNTQFPAISRSIVSMFVAQDITASPNGWINDCPGGVCTANETQTVGNNTIVCVDSVAPTNTCDTQSAGVLDGNGRPTGNPDANGRNRDFLGTSPRDFETGFLPPPQDGNPESGQTASGSGANGNNALDQFRRASVVQQFYSTNWYHDKLFALGFDEAAGNFQALNFGGMGLGNDPIRVDIHDGSGTNNANFSTPPDGQSGRAQMYVFTGPSIDRDGGLDSELLFHELTHGTSNRLIGNGAGLEWDIGASMGEGWSDFYSMSLLNNTNADDPDAVYAAAPYATYKFLGFPFEDNYAYGIRRFPYSTVNTVNPLTWADVDEWTNNLSGGIAPDPFDVNFAGALEVHNAGEIWALTLWEMRSRIIAANGGSVPTGNQISLQLVTDAMKLTPLNPSFIQARDALIAADCATNSCANEEHIWGAFADRGLGYGAKAPNSASFAPIASHMGVLESFSSPNLDINSVSINDAIGNGSGFADPNEPVDISIDLANPWQNASKTATGVTTTISSLTPGVLIMTPSASYPDIAPGSSASQAGTPIRIRVPSSMTCGSRMNFTLTVSSSLGTAARTFSIRLGEPSGTLSPIIYTRNSVGLAIPDYTPSGVADSMTISDDFEIADLNVRINDLTHTFPGDLTFGIRGPNGYGTDTLTFLGGLVSGGGDGDNIVNMAFDDEATGEVLTQPSSSAPYTNSFRPVFNSSEWTAAGFPAGESIGQLSNFDGISTQGTWTARVSDQGPFDTGTLHSWSLIITPRAFGCTPFVTNAADVSISGRVLTAEGRGVRNAIVTLVNSQGVRVAVRTGTYGTFEFNDVEAGQSYTLMAEARGSRFSPKVIDVSDNIAELNFIDGQ